MGLYNYRLRSTVVQYGAHKGTLSVAIFFISFVRNIISGPGPHHVSECQTQVPTL